MSKDILIKKLNLFHDAGVAVIGLRTREPILAETVLRQWADAGNHPFNVWDLVKGWRHWVAGAASSDTPPTTTNASIADPGLALAHVANKQPGTSRGLFVMHNTAQTLVASAKAQHMIIDYVREFSIEATKRLVLILPETFIVPPYVQHDLTLVDFDLPDKVELMTCLDFALESAMAGSENGTKFTAKDKELLVSSAAGLTAFEAETAFCLALMDNLQDWVSGKADVTKVNQRVLDTKTEVIKRSEVLELMPPVNADEVGGLELAKEYLMHRKSCFTEEARNNKVPTPKGIALIGPPRTGKSLLAKVIASVFSMPLIKFDIGKVFGGIIGQTEERIRGALKMLEACSPCVVLFDEVDKAGIDPRQAGGDSGVGKRVVGSLLTFMQECNKPVYFVFTLNRVDNVPPELLGKGRLDDVFFVGAPSAIERKEIVTIHLKKIGLAAKDVKNLDMFVTKSDGYVGAEIESAVKEAKIASHTTGKPITGEGLLAHIKTSLPASVKFKEDYDSIVAWGEANARPASHKERGTPALAYEPKARSRKLGGSGSN